MFKKIGVGLAILYGGCTWTADWRWYCTTKQNLRQHIATLEIKRNAHRCTFSWRFTSKDARVKLQGLYPVNPSSVC